MVPNGSIIHLSIMLFNLPKMKEHLHAFYLKDNNESCLDGSSHRGTLILANDIVNIQDLSSFSSQVPLYKDKSCPLLLDNQAGLELEENVL